MEKSTEYSFETDRKEDEMKNILNSLLHKRLKYILFKDIVIIAFLVILLFCSYYFWDQTFIIFRLFLVQIVHPFLFDLSVVSDQTCLLDNPLYSKYKPESCDAKFDIITEKQMHISQLRYERIVLEEKKWLLIKDTDVLSRWPLVNIAESIKSLAKYYNKDKDLIRGYACELDTNLKHKVPRYAYLLSIVESNDSWYMSWKHCGQNQTHAFRKLYVTPHFLPVYAQMTDSGWLFTINNFDNMVLLPKSSTHIIHITVITGDIRLYITPVICEQYNKSQEYSVAMSPGDMFSSLNYPGVSLDIGIKQRFPHDSSDKNNRFTVVMVLFPDIDYNL